MNLIFGLGFVLFLYLGAEGKWLLAFISAFSAFALAVTLERMNYKTAHAAAMKSEHDRKQGADDAFDCLLELKRDPDVLVGALRLIESAQGRGYGIDYARGVAQSALRHHEYEQEKEIEQ